MGKGNRAGNPAPAKKATGGRKGKGSLATRAIHTVAGEHIDRQAEKYAAPNPLKYWDERRRKWFERPHMTGLSTEDAKHLQMIRKSAYKLDYKFGVKLCCCCGKKIHFGKSVMFGFIPFAGAIIDVTLGVVKINKKVKQLEDSEDLQGFKLSGSAKWGLYLRHVASEGPGFIPWVGDIWIGYYKVNSRNVAAIERALLEHMVEKGRIVLEEVA